MGFPLWPGEHCLLPGPGGAANAVAPETAKITITRTRTAMILLRAVT